MNCRNVLLIAVILSSLASAEQLQPATVTGFQHYVSETEQRMDQELKSGGFLSTEAAPSGQSADFYARLRKGEVLTKRLQTLENGRAIKVPGGLVHHWIGTVFIPGATLVDTMHLLQDYDDQYKYYAPEVERSRLLRRNGNDFHVYLRLRRKKVVSVVLNTEYDVEYTMLGNDRARARSYSTRIAEVEHPGAANETEKPVGSDNGFLWRLDSYWQLWQRDGGIYVQLEVVSLSREIPAGLGWLIGPLVTTVPQESLQFTLVRTRASLCCAQPQAHGKASPARLRPGAGVSFGGLGFRARAGCAIPR